MAANPAFNIALKAFKEGFFDRKAVIRDLDTKTRKVFSKLGAYIMRGARKSIKSDKKGKGYIIAQPGKPPIGHTGKLKKSILFKWDSANRSVVVGPYLFDGGVKNPTIPQLLEYGGRSAENGRRYHAFPFMRPARDRELPKLPQFWREAA